MTSETTCAGCGARVRVNDDRTVTPTGDERADRAESALRFISGVADTLSPQEFINVAAEALRADRHTYPGSADPNKSAIELGRELKDECARADRAEASAGEMRDPVRQLMARLGESSDHHDSTPGPQGCATCAAMSVVQAALSSSAGGRAAGVIRAAEAWRDARTMAGPSLDEEIAANERLDAAVDAARRGRGE